MKTNTLWIRLQLLFIVEFVTKPISGLDINFADLKLYEVLPTKDEHLMLLKELRQSNSGLLFWNGIGEIGEQIDFLASNAALEHYKEEFKSANLEVTVCSSEVELTITTPSSSTNYLKQSSSTFIGTNANKKLWDTIPIQRINGTKLYSGIFYEIGMKRFPEGWVTWTERKTRDGQNNYVQIDRNPENLLYYVEGMKWYSDVQWTFAPSKNSPGAYSLRNKADLKALTTVVKETNDGYHHVILQRNGNELKSVLWKPIETSEEGMYLLKSDNFSLGTVTWTETKYGDYSYFIQMSLNENHRPKYNKDAEWYDDALFQFKSPKVDFKGQISHFETIIQTPTDDSLLIYKQNTKRTIVNELILHNRAPYSVTRNISDIVNTHNEIGITFDQNLTSFSIVKGTLSLPTITSRPFQIEFELNEPTFVNTTKKEQYLVDSVIEISAGKSKKVSIYVDKIENVKIPFEAMMFVQGEADGILSDYSGFRKTSLPHEVLQEMLISRGFKSNKVSSIQDSTVVCWVSGQMDVSYVLDVGVVTECYDKASPQPTPSPN